MYLTALKETRKCSGFVIYSYLKDCAFTEDKRDARVKFLTGYVKGDHFLIEGIRKGCIFCQKWFVQVYRIQLS